MQHIQWLSNAEWWFFLMPTFIWCNFAIFLFIKDLGLGLKTAGVKDVHCCFPKFFHLGKHQCSFPSNAYVLIRSLIDRWRGLITSLYSGVYGGVTSWILPFRWTKCLNSLFMHSPPPSLGICWCFLFFWRSTCATWSTNFSNALFFVLYGR